MDFKPCKSHLGSCHRIVVVMAGQLKLEHEKSTRTSPDSIACRQ